MADMTFDRELLEQVHKLDEDQQRRVLEFARILAQASQVRGESGHSILQSAGLFHDEDLDEMARAIEEDCERIDWSGWE
jgi:hypothetical protein